nr:Chain A, Major structural protein [Pseudomonas phage vB_PaeM_E217]8FRS_B Chain B, Major structural protein [Pseudomonas phage vB_PaeM_E217]8FRS_C Chain C, Major structural protein [Pseudomonas phage vB_PaeM_E217]8FRS_D Chain D, Major structural protein [Pseudomonas phage vB_PaeM_E217]8FRS_E Chain E, Major structural protein [Pseudomonas phage vB_PaeM_E217]8FRS_F Chain F, Major structural protein [Pseudomonas phage vB_PaeM_E217]8FRS_G Chain G, Major structural protein [Pseudomonas phage vB_
NFTAPVTTPSIPTPIQFLQTWLPGFVKVMTAARKIDEIIGIDTVGSWEDQEIVQGIVEPAGTAVEYGDHTNIPLTSWNANFERRTIVRGELGMMVGTLEEGRASAIRLNSAETKRQQAAIGLETFRNAIGFYGWQSGLGNRTYGFLNDPNLPAFQTPPSQGWSTADWAGIIGDIREAVRQLRIQSQDQIDPKAEKITLALATSKVDYLSVTTPYGISVSDWIEQTYPKMRIVSAPELSGVQMKNQEPEDALVLFVEDVNAAVDGSTDGGSVFSQLVQSKFITLGVEKRAKSYVEDFSNGTAGALCKRPWAVVRYLGI